MSARFAVYVMQVQPHFMVAAKPRKLSPAKQHAQIEDISIVGVGGRMGPIALWLYAESYLKAAKAVPLPDGPYEPTRYFLVCHSIELGLKAFLSIQGATMLQLSDSGRQQIEKASDYYSSKVFEYPAVAAALRAYPGLPDIKAL